MIFKTHILITFYASFKAISPVIHCQIMSVSSRNLDSKLETTTKMQCPLIGTLNKTSSLPSSCGGKTNENLLYKTDSNSNRNSSDLFKSIGKGITITNETTTRSSKITLNTTEDNTDSEITPLETTSVGAPESATSFFDFFDELLRNSTVDDIVLSCSCVQYYLCDPSDIIVPQLQNDKVIPKIRVEMETCRSSSNTSGSEVCCSKNSTIELFDKESLPNSERCGIRNVGGIANQTSGANFNSDYGEFPWLVAILTRVNKKYAYRCSGTLIDQGIVITSAHCVNRWNTSEIKIRAGEWNTRNSDEFFPHQDRLLKKIVIHEDFNPKNLHNDIALLILKEPVTFHINVGKICLPEIDFYQAPVNATCFTTGWGKDSYDVESYFAVIPKKVSLQLIEHNECQENFRNTRLGKYFSLHESFICAKDEDSCIGDGGSPLMCSLESQEGVYQLIGMVAWGLGCRNNNPAVYVNVPWFRNWISNEVLSLIFSETSV